MTNELLKHRIKRELRSRGVRTRRLLLDVSDDRIVVSGEVATYYEVQLIQVFSKSLGEGRQVHNNLSVVPGVLDTPKNDPPPKEVRSELHHARNQLNELSLAIRLLDKYLDLGRVDEAKTVIAETLESIKAFGSVDSLKSEMRETDTDLSHLRLLVIEDDTHQNLLLTGLLRRFKADVARAGDAETAYRVLNEGFTADIILLDMHLPDEDGPRIAREIRKRPHCKAVRIIALSGTHPSEVGLSLDDGEIDAWLPKPINVEKLLQAIRKFSRAEK